MTAKLVGLNLRRLRVAAGLSQERLSALVGHNLNYVGAVERGAVKPSATALHRLAQLLNVDTAEFERSGFEPVGNLPRGRPRGAFPEQSASRTRHVRSGVDTAPESHVRFHGSTPEEKST